MKKHLPLIGIILSISLITTFVTLYAFSIGDIKTLEESNLQLTNKLENVSKIDTQISNNMIANDFSVNSTTAFQNNLESSKNINISNNVTDATNEPKITIIEYGGSDIFHVGDSFIARIIVDSNNLESFEITPENISNLYPAVDNIKTRKIAENIIEITGDCEQVTVGHFAIDEGVAITKDGYKNQKTYGGLSIGSSD